MLCARCDVIAVQGAQSASSGERPEENVLGGGGERQGNGYGNANNNPIARRPLRTSVAACLDNKMPLARAYSFRYSRTVPLTNTLRVHFFLLAQFGAFASLILFRLFSSYRVRTKVNETEVVADPNTKRE